MKKKAKSDFDIRLALESYVKARKNKNHLLTLIYNELGLEITVKIWRICQGKFTRFPRETTLWRLCLPKQIYLILKGKRGKERKELLRVLSKKYSLPKEIINKMSRKGARYYFNE